MKDLRILDDKIEAGLASNDDRDKRINIHQEAHNLANLKDMDTIQKARVKWDIERDENTKFFHGLINQKQKFKANDSMIYFPPTPISYTLQHSDRDFLESTLAMDELKTAVSVIKALHGIEGGFDFNGYNHNAHLNELLLEISLLNVRADNDKCVWSIDNDGIFAVGPLRRLIDDRILPSLDSLTTW
ncbi:hypothetical protein Tco_1168702, partial [Tanacetum coccineum]